MKHLRRFILVFTVNFAFFFVLHTSAIEANVAVIKLTPPLEMGYTLGGYGARMSKPAQGIHDDIWAKALVLNDGGKKYAIVTLDILGLPPNVKPQVIETQSGGMDRREHYVPSQSFAYLPGNVRPE